MPRTIPPERFDDLVREATEVFIHRGYRKTQMAEIAEAVGVSKPTLYLYVESKAALFTLCCQHADDRKRVEVPESLPVPDLPPGEGARQLGERLARAAGLPLLRAAARKERADDIRSELRSIAEELYTTVESNCRTLKLLDRCWDHPEFGPEWQKQGREGPRDRVGYYMARRLEAGQLPVNTDPMLAGRLLIESVATWAMHIKWDRLPQAFEPVQTKSAVIEFIVNGLLSAGPEAS